MIRKILRSLRQIQRPISKIIAAKREISFVENSDIRELNLGKKKLHLIKTGRSFLPKNLINYNKKLAWTNSLDDLATLEKFISNTLNDTEPNARSQLGNLRRDNWNKIIFAHLNINSIRNKFDQLADAIKRKIMY